MNLEKLQQKMLAAARAGTPDNRVPYAFEKRITALIAGRVRPQNLDVWVRGLWRAAVSCVAVAVVCGAWVLLSPPPGGSGPGSDDLSQRFENTLLASVDQGDSSP
jgi:hypothetical protein